MIAVTVADDDEVRFDFVRASAGSRVAGEERINDDLKASGLDPMGTVSEPGVCKRHGYAPFYPIGCVILTGNGWFMGVVLHQRKKILEFGFPLNMCENDAAALAAVCNKCKLQDGQSKIIITRNNCKEHNSSW